VERDTGVPAWAGGLAGALAGAAALAAGQLVADFTADQAGPVTAVANNVRDASPAGFTRWAIDAVGTNDKPLLLTGVVVVSLILAFALGVASRRRPVVGVAGLVAFGALGVAAMNDEPTGGAQGALVIGLFSVAVGVAVLLGLLATARSAWRSGSGGAGASTGTLAVAGDPAIRRPTRRTFLTASGLVGAGAVVATVAGRPGRDPGRVEVARRATVLPRAQGASVVEAAVAEAGRHPVATTPDLSPLITPNDDFYRIDTALIVPQVDIEGWRLKITGMVTREASWSYAQLVERATTLAPVTLSCVSNPVGGPLVGTALWQGIPLRDLLDEAGVEPAASQVVGRSVDGFTAGFPTSALDGDRTALLALGMNGEPLPVRHGFPARLVVAGLYGYVSATKWLQSIELTTWDAYDAYWIPRGWSKEGPIRTQSRIDTPRDDRTLQPGVQVIGGVAWAPSVGIERVEVQVDDGPWQEAEVGDRLDDDVWVQWRAPWDAMPGKHRVRVRATDRTGAIQPEERRATAPNGATGWHTVDVTVR
jgi:DMSO/TMAO reductase YedYZ molybdopterin-dependent catalytic subunit